MASEIGSCAMIVGGSYTGRWGVGSWGGVVVMATLRGYMEVEL